MYGQVNFVSSNVLPATMCLPQNVVEASEDPSFDHIAPTRDNTLYIDVEPDIYYDSAKDSYFSCLETNPKPCQDVCVNLVRMEYVYLNFPCVANDPTVHVTHEKISRAHRKEFEFLRSAFNCKNKPPDGGKIPFVFERLQDASAETVIASSFDTIYQNLFADVDHFRPDPDVHEEKGKFVCSLCYKCFPMRCYLNRHTLIHSKVRNFTCPECPKTYKYKGDLTKHMMIHTGVKNYRCSLCPKAVKSKSELDKHMSSHSDERNFTCSVCSKAFKSKRELDKHMFSHSDVRRFTCPLCPMTFKVKSYLNQHVTVHSRPRNFKCTSCVETFRFKRQLIAHLKRHRTDKKHGCTLCSKSFQRKRELDAHVDSHIQGQSFECAECSQSFKYKFKLIKHLDKHKKI